MDKNAWQIAVFFAGAALGGMYLGGYEWLRFFAYFGSWGTFGLIGSSIGLGWFGYQVLLTCYRHGLRSLHDLFSHFFGEAIAPSLSALTHFFLLTYAGAITSQYASTLSNGFTAWFLILLPILIAAALVLGGWQRITSGMAISLSAGFLLYALIFMDHLHVPIPSLGYQLNFYWMVHALSFLGLHFLLCLVLCLPFTSRAANERSILLGVRTGCLLFFAVALLGHAILLAYWHDVHSSAAPTMLIISQLLPAGGWGLATLSILHLGIWIAALFYALAAPVAHRHDLRLQPIILVMMGTMVVFGGLTQAFPWSLSILASGATYCGLLLLLRMLWVRQRL
ncbi:hypothetical protein ACQKK5_01945 [Brevibacillus panacihumi]|uniref:hypothetical protein n=1 Tax=Brevibacillus panacihumi TaxID=497735 RepID=UPI003D06DEA8